jgi:sialate O-acetylesterase
MDALPHAAYAVALDLGEPDDIHPKDKKPVGRRLALAALATTYGKPVEYCGPRAGALSFEAGKLRLQLSHAQGLTLTASEPRSFEIAGKDGKFHRAHALVDGRSLLLWSKAVADPSAARYAWSDDPQAELYNGEGLPAGPFSVALP